MKIAYFADNTPVLGGAGNVLLEQARIMSSIHEVIVVLPLNDKGEMCSEYILRCQKADLKYTGLCYTTAFRIQDIDIVRAWKDFKEIRDWAIQENIRFFHSVQLNISAELAAREAMIPHLMNIYQLGEEEFSLKCMDIFPRYHSCDSEKYCKIWRDNLGVKTCCIRPAAPLNMIKKKNREKSNALNILMLGGFEERKNQLCAIQAVEYCNRRGLNITLTIAGDDNTGYGRKCIKYIQENRLYKKIFIAGFQSDIVPLLLDNDCLLCSSKDESFPSSIVEAITYDLLIISTPVAGVPELLKDNVNAYISKGYETRDIIEIITKCFFACENGLTDEIHNNAENLWENYFSQNIIRKKLNMYYSEILEDYTNNYNRCLENKISEYDCREIYKKICRISYKFPHILKKIYYYTNLFSILDEGIAYIWGAGHYGEFAKEMIELLFPQIKVIAYIDRIKQGDYQGLPIYSCEYIEKESVDYIFISFREGHEEVIEYLEKRGYKKNIKAWILP